MKILIVHRYFWPDTPPYAKMLRDIAARLTKDGHEVTVFSTQPSYQSSNVLMRQPSHEVLDGFEVWRVWLVTEYAKNVLLRGLNSLIFALRVGLHLMTRRYDVVMAATAPPIVLARAAAYFSSIRGARLIYHCQDIHPESGVLAGLIVNKVLIWILKKIDIRTCEVAMRIVVLSSDMADAIRSRGLKDASKIHVINNFALDSIGNQYAAKDARVMSERKSFKIIFAGNIGRFQGLEAVIDAVRLLQDSGVELLLVGAGASKEALAIRAGDLLNRSVYFLSHRSQAEVEQLISESDAGLIALQPGVFRFAYPSKTATYMKMGRPLLVCMELASELARMVKQEDVGVISEPGDPEAIAAAIDELRNRKTYFESQQTRIIALGIQKFGGKQALDKWSKLFNDVSVSIRL